MANLNSIPLIAENDLYASSATVPGGLSVGQLFTTGDGRKFRYALAGASALVVGNLLQAPAQDTTYENMAVLASAIATSGIQTVNITNGTSTITSAQYQGGSVSVYTAPDLGSTYGILGVTGTLTTGGALVVSLDRNIQVAWTTATKVNMKRNPWSGVIQFPASTQTEIPVGVAFYAVAATQYGWVQTGGDAAVLSDGQTFAVGSMVGTPSATAGSVTVAAAGTGKTIVGNARMAQSLGHVISVFLTID